MRTAAPLAPLFAMLLLAPALSGCLTRYIPNTDVEDTDENRRVIDFCETYRHAVEEKNVGQLMKLAHPDYYEDGGNVDARDDIDYTGLSDYLSTKFDGARTIRYEIRYRRVVRTDDLVYVDYTYSASYKIPGATGQEKWRRKVEENRLELVPVADSYKIVAGM